jgi:hypothetical protein
MTMSLNPQLLKQTGALIPEKGKAVVPQWYNSPYCIKSAEAVQQESKPYRTHMPASTSTKSGVSNSDESGVKAASCKTEILFRVWRRGSVQQKLPSPDEASARPSGIVAFIQDVVASRHGVLVSTDANLYISVLENPSQALVVARQIQLGMQEFQKKSRTQPIAISIAIDASVSKAQSTEVNVRADSEATAETPPALSLQPSHDLLTLIRMSKPAQILLTHELFQKVHLFRGLPLKTFPGRFGVFEYLWTAEEKLLELEGEQARFADADEIQGNQTDHAEFPGQGSIAASQGSAKTLLQPTGTKWGMAGATRFWRSPWSIATAATLLLVIFTAGGIAFRANRAKTEANSPGVKNLAPAVQNPVIHSDVNPGRPAVISTTPQGPPSKAVKKIQPPPKSNSSKPDRSVLSVDKNAEESAPSKTCSLTGGMDRYLRQAEYSRGRGDYESAERLFSEVLDCDPKNERARTGLDRTRAAKR